MWAWCSTFRPLHCNPLPILKETPTQPCAICLHAADLAWRAQSKPVHYLHVGMVQHDPAGRIAFLHRTAEGKFHPFVRDFRHVHVLTVPLSPVRAAATLGNRQRHMGFEKLQVSPKTQNLNSQAQAATPVNCQCHIGFKKLQVGRSPRPPELSSSGRSTGQSRAPHGV